VFATRCIENGMESRPFHALSRHSPKGDGGWLGHQDGEALCMKTYGNLRDGHSANEAKKVAF